MVHRNGFDSTRAHVKSAHVIFVLIVLPENYDICVYRDDAYFNNVHVHGFFHLYSRLQLFSKHQRSKLINVPGYLFAIDSIPDKETK